MVGKLGCEHQLCTLRSRRCTPSREARLAPGSRECGGTPCWLLSLCAGLGSGKKRVEREGLERLVVAGSKSW